MAKQSGKQDQNGRRENNDLEAEVDALFKLSLAEFTGARNALAARLKKSGRGNEADFVKTLSKPSVSAWAVNQLFWHHRDAFDELIVTGQNISQAQASRAAGKLTDLRDALETRRETLTHLSELATELLQSAGHNPTPDTIRRISTTLDALSVYASLSSGPTPGRLTGDVDPPGFETLASLISGSGITAPKQGQQQKSGGAASARQKTASGADKRREEETRQAKISAAKSSLQEAKSLLADARARSTSAENSKKKADAEAKDAESEKRDAEKLLEDARSILEDANRRARIAAAEVKDAAKALDDAKRAVEMLSKDLELLFRESPR